MKPQGPGLNQSVPAYHVDRQPSRMLPSVRPLMQRWSCCAIPPSTERTQLINAIRGHLTEYGWVAPEGAVACGDACQPARGRRDGQFGGVHPSFPAHLSSRGNRKVPPPSRTRVRGTILLPRFLMGGRTSLIDDGDGVGQLHGMRCQHSPKSGTVPPMSPPQVVHIEETGSLAADYRTSDGADKVLCRVWRSNA